jgi:hypothetical protein
MTEFLLLKRSLVGANFHEAGKRNGVAPKYFLPTAGSPATVAMGNSIVDPSLCFRNSPNERSLRPRSPASSHIHHPFFQVPRIISYISSTSVIKISITCYLVSAMFTKTPASRKHELRIGTTLEERGTQDRELRTLVPHDGSLCAFIHHFLLCLVLSHYVLC